jgi:hypothetical protein
MASLVNPSNINGNFPIAGQDNDSQGFRDNFTNIRNNFTFIKAEVEDLQAKAVLKSALIGSTLDNNFLGSQLKNTQLKNFSETLYDWGNTSGEIQLDLALGNAHKVYTDGSISINSVIKNWPSSLQYSRLLLYITISNSAHTLTIPNNITTSLEGLPGLRFIGSNNLITFPETGTYVYEFASPDSGTTVFVRELSRASHLFRDPNFFFTDIGAGASGGSHPSGYEAVTLKINYGNVLTISGNIDTAKDNTDALSVKGGITSYFGLNLSEGSNSTNLMRSAGFTVARSRAETPPAGTAVTINSASRVQDGDVVGYFNGMAVTQAITGSTNPFLQLASMQIYARGEQDSIGGNIVFATKTDGGALTAAMIIDNAQNVTIAGNLTVDGSTTTINSTVLTVDDKNIIMAAGTASSITANGAGISVDTAWANIEYHGPESSPAVSTYGGGDRWISNKSFAIANSASSSSSTTGALVVAGGLGVGGDLNVGGTFGLTSSTNSTSKDTGAFVLTAGGLGVELNVVAGGIISANSTAESFNSTSGALISAGGLAVAKVGFFAGNVFAASTTESTSDTIGSIITAGGVGISKRLNVVGNVVFNSGTESNYTMGSGGTNYSGALIVSGGAHVTKTLNVGNDAGEGRIRINVPVSALAGTIADFTTGALLVGAPGYAGGMSVTGNFNLGQDASGVLYIVNKNSSRGTEINSTPTPYVPFQTGGQPVYGAATVLGGINVFGNIFVGQPDTGAGTPRLVNSGNLYVQSGALSTSATTGAIVIQKVSMPAGTSPDGFSRGGLGMEGNLYAVGNVILGGSGSGDTNSNVVVDAATVGVSTTQAALVVRGGVGIAGITQTGGNVLTTSSTAGRLNVAASNAKEGALVLTSGGAYITGTSVIQGNLVLTSTSSSADTVTGALVITGTGGLGVGGAGNFGGGVTIAGTTAGGNGTGALVLSGTSGGIGAGASIAGNLFVQGPTQPINAVGASGVALLSASNTPQAAITNTTADLTNLTFTPEANKTYWFEAFVPYSVVQTSGVAAVMTPEFSVVATQIGAGGTGTLRFETTMIVADISETNSTTAPVTHGLDGSGVFQGAQTASTATATTINNLWAKITGTYYHTAVSTVKIQGRITSGATHSMTVLGSAFLKWTKLN